MPIVISFYAIAAVLLAVGVVSSIKWKRAHDYLSPWGLTAVLTYIFGGLIAIVMSLVLVFTAVDRQTTRRRCEAVAVNRDAKFVEYNLFTYECLVKSTKGRYVPLSQVDKIELETGN